MSDAWRQELIQAGGDDARVVLSEVDAHAADMPDSLRALTDVRQFINAFTDMASACRRLRHHPYIIILLMDVGAVSRYGCEIAIRYPDDYCALVQERQFSQVWGRRLLVRRLAETLQDLSTISERQQALVHFKHIHFLRIILGDISGELPIEAVVRELSDVTDTIAQAAYDSALERLEPRFGQFLPRKRLEGDKASGVYRAIREDTNVLSDGFTVLAMGKLGGRELNYSSDIDLIFIYHVAAGHEQQRDWHEAFIALGKEIIALLERPDGATPIYRVDMRLRPEGERGELALSVRETVDYYYSVGRPWERQAMIKVRPIAGDLDIGQKFLDELRPWVYPQEPDWATLDEARSMRRRIEERARGRDVKTGAGGIRDIEFLVQFFQLCFGGRQPELRLRATLPTLRLLVDRGILPREHASDLEQAYIFLRTVEHRLQMYEDRQEHEIPLATPSRTRLAWSVDQMDVQSFDARLAQIRSRVRELVALHFLAAGKEQDAALALVVQGEANEALAKSVLSGYGLKDIPRAAAQLKALATEPFFVLSRHRTERALVALLPELLVRISQSPAPDQALANLVRVVTAVGGRATFLEMLAARREVLDLITGFAGWANYLVDLFARFPGLTDEIVDSMSTKMRPASLLGAEARALVHGISAVAEPLAFMLAKETAVLALRDLDGLPQREVGQRLTALAEAIVSTVLLRLSAEHVRQRGAPVNEGRPTRFVVLGIGKLGGREMAYASDLDLIFICDPGGRCSKADDDGESFWTQVTQTLMRTLGDNRLYDVDPRLRPWGDQGQLVINTRTLSDYWAEPRDLWERMAMLRVYVLAGDERLGNEALAIIRAAAYTAPLPLDAVAQVVDMRRRLEHSVEGKDHIKRGKGGYVDHEFIAQYFSLGLNPDELIAASGSLATADVLKGLAQLQRIPAEAATELISSLARLRFIEARLRLAVGKAISTIPTGREERTELAVRCGYENLSAFDLDLHDARSVGRRWFTSLIGTV